MSAVKRLGEEIAEGLKQEVPGLTKPVVRKLSLAVEAMIEGQTPNTVELSNLLPLETERQDFEGAMVETLIKIAGVTLRSRDDAFCLRIHTESLAEGISADAESEPCAWVTDRCRWHG